jgi:hypothetical protein
MTCALPKIMSLIMFLFAPVYSLSQTSQTAFFTARSITRIRSITKHHKNFRSPHRHETAIFFQESSKDEQSYQSTMEKDTSLQALNMIDNNENMKSIQSEEQESFTNSIKTWFSSIVDTSKGGPPPMQIEDVPVLLYDIFLILNLSVSISFWVVHRMSFASIVPAFSEGSLLSILWVIAGLWNGAFLYSAVDGHYDTSKEENQDKGGPVSAAMLGLSTFVGTANLRVIVALGMAVLEHRKVGGTDGEELIPLEIAFGLMLMSAWRMLHSSYTAR